MGTGVVKKIACVLAVVVVPAVGGCRENLSPVAKELLERSGPYSPQTQRLLNQWLDLAQTATKANPNLQQAIDLSDELVKADPRSRMFILDALSEPQLSPMAKIVARFSLQAMGLDQPAIDRLVVLAKPDADLATRLCAVELLGSIAGDSQTALLESLLTDSNRQIRFVATHALAVQDPKFRPNLRAFWSEPETTGDEKVTITLALADGPAFDSLPVFHEVINNRSFGEPVKAVALHALSQVGDSESLPALAQCEQNDPNPTVRLAARTAIEAIEQRCDPSPVDAVPEATLED